ncbi:MAG: S8 family serine peptidase, partial [Hyphomicrobiaceae bacterium]
GVDIMTANPGGTYDLASGTSFAAAHVSAVAALLLAKSSRLDRDKLLAQLKATATDLGPPGPDEKYGAGCVNALRALTRQAVMTSGQQ